jgi:hypothetical protein
MYVALKTKNSPTRYIDLPLVIGRSGLCEVIINSPAVAEASKYLHHEGNDIVLVDVQSKKTISTNTLDAWGIKVSGPIPGKAANAKRLTGFLSRLFATERRMFGILPLSLRTVLLGFLGQPARLGAWIAIAAFVIISCNMIPEPKAVDLSNRAIPLKYGRMFTQEIGSRATDSAYAKGARFQIDAAGKQNLLLAFEAVGLDIDREIVVKVGGYEVFATELNPKCIDRWCEFSIPIQDADSKALDLKFAHAESASAYGIRNIAVIKLKEFKPEELTRAQNSFDLALRSFNDRDIAVENLVQAKKETDSLYLIFRSRSGQDDLRAKVLDLRGQIEREYSSRTEDLMFKADRFAALGNYKEAIESMELMLQLYPDPETRRNQFLRGKLQAISEMQR